MYPHPASCERRHTSDTSPVLLMHAQLQSRRSPGNSKQEYDVPTITVWKYTSHECSLTSVNMSYRNSLERIVIPLS